jgi:hypothetical protein
MRAPAFLCSLSGNPAALGTARRGHYIAGMPWNSRLGNPIMLADGRVLRTLADARDMVVSLPERDQRRDNWQTLAPVLLSAAQADSPSLTAIAPHRMEESLAPAAVHGGAACSLLSVATRFASYPHRAGIA